MGLTPEGAVSSRCSCPAWGKYGPHCKHAVALAHADRTESLGPPRRRRLARPGEVVPLPALAKLESWLGLSALPDYEFLYRLDARPPAGGGRAVGGGRAPPRRAEEGAGAGEALLWPRARASPRPTSGCSWSWRRHESRYDARSRARRRGPRRPARAAPARGGWSTAAPRSSSPPSPRARRSASSPSPTAPPREIELSSSPTAQTTGLKDAAACSPAGAPGCSLGQSAVRARARLPAAAVAQVAARADHGVPDGAARPGALLLRRAPAALPAGAAGRRPRGRRGRRAEVPAHPRGRRRAGEGAARPRATARRHRAGLARARSTWATPAAPASQRPQALPAAARRRSATPGKLLHRARASGSTRRPTSTRRTGDAALDVLGARAARRCPTEWERFAAAAPKVRMRPAAASRAIRVDMSGVNWFELDADFVTDDQAVDLGAVRMWLDSGRRFIPLKDGTFAEADRGELQARRGPARGGGRAAGQEAAPGCRCYQAAALDLLAGARRGRRDRGQGPHGDRRAARSSTASPRCAAARGAQRDAAPLPGGRPVLAVVPPPPRAVGHPRRRHGPGQDGAGAGAAAARRKNEEGRKPSLVVAPTSVLANWEREVGALHARADAW